MWFRGRTEGKVGRAVSRMKSENYGDDCQAHLLEQYKLYVEMADRISQRREQSNRFYAGLVSAIIALLVVMGRFGVSGSSWSIALLAAGVFGALLSVVWFINLGSYRAINTAKFRVINKMESQMPYAGYSEEWAYLRPAGGPARYLQLTRIERYVPLLIMMLFLGILGYAVYSLVNGSGNETAPAARQLGGVVQFGR